MAQAQKKTRDSRKKQICESRNLCGFYLLVRLIQNLYILLGYTSLVTMVLAWQRQKNTHLLITTLDKDHMRGHTLNMIAGNTHCAFRVCAKGVIV